jgi:hypothetical protein
VETEGMAVTLLRAISDNVGSRIHASLRAALLSCG